MLPPPHPPTNPPPNPPPNPHARCSLGVKDAPGLLGAVKEEAAVKDAPGLLGADVAWLRDSGRDCDLRPNLAGADVAWLRHNDLGPSEDGPLAPWPLGPSGASDEASDETSDGAAAPSAHQVDVSPVPCTLPSAYYVDVSGRPSFNWQAALRLQHATPQERTAGACFSILEGLPVSPKSPQLP